MNDPISKIRFDIIFPLKPADFAYFARSRHWKNEEVSCLALGVDPRTFADNEDDFLEGRHSGNLELQAFVAGYVDIEKLISGYFTTHNFDVRSPQFWVNWLLAMKLPCPEEMVNAVQEFGGTHTNWEELAKAADSDLQKANERIARLETAIADKVIANPASTKERESLLKLVIGMAVKGYGFDPKAKKSPITNDIENDLALLGISLTHDTIRKYLTEATKHLPLETPE